jgi:hypothetical protein
MFSLSCVKSFLLDHRSLAANLAMQSMKPVTLGTFKTRYLALLGHRHLPPSSSTEFLPTFRLAVLVLDLQGPEVHVALRIGIDLPSR